MSTPGDADVRISYLPTPGLSYDPSEPRYWDPAALEGEVLRAFDICNGCRMCFKFSDSFPRLFELLDQKEHDVHRLDAAEIADWFETLAKAEKSHAGRFDKMLKSIG